jgi:phosphotransacetylase
VVITEKPPLHDQLEFFIEQAEKTRPINTVVVHPVDANSLIGATEAAEHNLITPILVGPEAKIKSVAEEQNLDISNYELINTEHSHAAAEIACEVVKRGEAEALMKGHLGTSELLVLWCTKPKAFAPNAASAMFLCLICPITTNHS